MNKRPKNAPASATPYGLIAYRLEEQADRIFDECGIEYARPLWDIMSDLVDLNMEQS